MASTSLPSAVFILSASSDIGEQLALHYLDRGASVAGTYRTTLPESLRACSRFHALQCDVNAPASAKAIAEFLSSLSFRWDLFISCVGQLSPIGSFFECDFEEWARSVEINSLAQLRALHAVYLYRIKERVAHVVFFAGGGTNNPFRHYSAYCLGKISLIKMCELLDDENADLNIFIVGTGWVRTKIHQQTLNAGVGAGTSFNRTTEFLRQAGTGTTVTDIAAMIDWGISQGREVVGGRNFSVVHDPWREENAALSVSLRADADKFKLRRHGNH